MAGLAAVTGYLGMSTGFDMTLEELRAKWNSLANTDLSIAAWDPGLDVLGRPAFSYGFPLKSGSGLLALHGLTGTDGKVQSLAVAWTPPPTPSSADLADARSVISTMIEVVDSDNPSDVVDALGTPPLETVPAGLNIAIAAHDCDFALVSFMDSPLPATRMFIIAFTT